MANFRSATGHLASFPVWFFTTFLAEYMLLPLAIGTLKFCAWLTVAKRLLLYLACCTPGFLYREFILSSEVEILLLISDFCARGLFWIVTLAIIRAQIRLRYIVASIKHRLYGYQPSTSRLILLPPELRLRIWEELMEIDWPIFIESGYGCHNTWMERFDFAFNVFEHKRKIRAAKSLPFAYTWTCRQIYQETSHHFYSRNTFKFWQPTALVRFVDGLSPVQQRTIGRLELDVSLWFSGRENCNYHMCLASPEVSLTLEKLQNLRTLDIKLDPYGYGPQRAKSAECHAQGIYQFLRDVKNFEVLTIEFNGSRLPWYLPVKQEARREWPSHCQEAFACAIWTLLGDPTRSIPRGVEIEDRNQAKCVLVAKFRER
ncbi:MAG: hypothetical protein ASARMPREDX12_001413 [Alectoria sarmentosa]|nr:MAG: hypothetical protein ASARMPREDX12_001413 [Alectoria sarmentosa]